MPDLRRALLAATLVWAAVTAAWALWPVEHGLRAQYFPNAEWVAPPSLTRIDPTLSTAHLNLARILERTGRVPAAIAEYEAFLRTATPLDEPLVPGARARADELRRWLSR